MQIENALKVMASIDELENGTPERSAIVADLHLKLLEDPETFFDHYFAALEGFRDDPLSDLATRMVSEGKTTFAEMRAALDAYNTVRPQQQ